MNKMRYIGNTQDGTIFVKQGRNIKGKN
jgi:hypothetical protein